MAPTNPVPVFDFNVFLMDARPESAAGLPDLGGAGLAKNGLFATFAEVSGLNAEMETEEYREGGSNTGPHKLIKWGKYPNLVFKRGVTASSDLWDWYYTILYKTKNPVRKNGFVLLSDRGGGPVAAWYFRNALPEKLQGPGLNAKSNEIAIETLELAHEGLYRFGPSMIPGLGGLLDATGS